jgi:uncharacterized protein (TIGR02145 family)
MRLKLRYSCLLVLAISCFTACKKKENTTADNKDEMAAKVSTLMNTQEGAASRFSEIFIDSQDSLLALIEMGKWVIQQPDVEEAYIVDGYIVEIHFKNGLKSNIRMISLDKNDMHHTRGGITSSAKTSSSRLQLMDIGQTSLALSTGPGQKMIGNDKVLIFAPYVEGFYYNAVYPYLPKFEQGKAKLYPQLISGENADLAVINTFADYGFVIIDTHGQPEGFIIKTKVPKINVPAPPEGKKWTIGEITDMFTQENNLPFDKFMSGELWLDLDIFYSFYKKNYVAVSRGVLVTPEYIRKIPRMKDAVVFANYCYSGYTAEGPVKNNMAEAFKSIGAISYYGYANPDGNSQSVSGEFSLAMEDSLITNLVKNSDSTGIAHLKGNIADQFELRGEESTRGLKFKIKEDLTPELYRSMHPPINEALYFRHFFDPGYSYGCGTFTDDRDQKVYKLACIGEQTWFAQNLDWAGAGYCYDGLASNCETYGRLYTYGEVTKGVSSGSNPSGVQGICPKGWHVPSKAEWDQMISFAGGAGTAGTKLKSPKLWPPANGVPTGTDEFGFAGLPSGNGDSGESDPDLFGFANNDTWGPMWTSDPPKNGFSSGYTFSALNNTAFTTSAANVGSLFACRCVQDK